MSTHLDKVQQESTVDAALTARDLSDALFRTAAEMRANGDRLSEPVIDALKSLAYNLLHPETKK